MKFKILFFTLLCSVLSWGQINENIQSWTNRVSYGNYTQLISAGTVTMTQCIVANAAAATGTCSAGRVQMNSSSGVIQLPTLASVGVVEIHLAAGAAGRSLNLQSFDGTSWNTLTTWTGIGTTGATYTHTLNSSASTTLRLSNPSNPVYVHDIIVTLYTTPTITLTPTSLSAFTYTVGSGPSAEQAFTVSGSNLTASVVLTAPTNYEISTTSGSGFGASVTLTQSGGVLSGQPVTVYVRLKSGLAINPYSGNVSATSTGATTKTVALSGNVVCSSAIISSIFPTTGPAGTEVTINASSGSLLNSTVTFNGTSASVVSSSAIQMVVVVPSAATTGTINITNTVSGCTATTPSFTVIKNDTSSCQSIYQTTTDLIIYEIHDENFGSGGTITLYNGTASTVTLSNYRLYRTNNYGDGNDVNYAALSGTIAPGALGVLHVSTGNTCTTPASTNGTISSGFNADDGISLRNSTGSTIIDDVHAYSGGAGFYMVRNSGAYSPRTTFVAADWSTTPLASGVCASGLGTPPATTPTIPVVNTEPSVSLTCTSTTASIVVTGSEGYVGGNALAYQWYAVATSTPTWSALTNTGVYTGVTTNTLSISSLSGLEGYQYYCQVRENTSTCYVATIAVKINTGLTTWNGSSWSNGSPSLTKGVVINGDYTTATDGSFSACKLIINATFTVTISPNDYVKIQNNLTNNGNLFIANNGQLIQINETDSNDGVYTGSKFQVQRIAQAKHFDYIYWSSPTENFPILSVPTNNHYEWDPLYNNTNLTTGNWQPASNNMLRGRGYIVRASNGATTAQSFPVTFAGKPFNGTFTRDIFRGNYDGADYDAEPGNLNNVLTTKFDDNWNLVGNPYPSAIDAEEFLQLNQTKIQGAIWVWKHGINPNSSVDPYYGGFVYNYSSNDYIKYNGLGSTEPDTFDGPIASGQGFLVNMLHTAATPNTITFTNNLRTNASLDIYDNSNFLRTNSNYTVNSLEEKHRIWLDIINPSLGQLDRTLVGYSGNSTNEIDHLYDCVYVPRGEISIFSLVATEPFSIQGRALPFNTQDIIPLGVKIISAGNHKIAIKKVDGLFLQNQDIYIEDTLLNIIHDVRQSPYEFSSTVGVFKDRFKLRYTTTTLGNSEFNSTQNVIVVAQSEQITIKSTTDKIIAVTIYDILGREIASKNNVSENQILFSDIKANNQALIVKIKLENGQSLTKKVML